MTQYAYFDSTISGQSPVIGWYDTGVAKYPNLPAASDLLELTATQWKARNTGAWAVNTTTSPKSLVSYTPPAPVPTLAQKAQALITAGLTITSTATPALNGTFAVASGVPFGREDIGTEAQFVSTFSEFTNGTTAIKWPLIDGRTFVKFADTASFMSFAKAAAQFYAACQAVIATGTGTLPPATATIP